MAICRREFSGATRRGGGCSAPTVPAMAVALLALGAALEGARSGLQFHPPTLVGPGSGYASNFQAISPSVFFGASLHDFISRDSGKTWQAPPAGLDCHSDSDWAGDRETRRSVSGGSIFHVTANPPPYSRHGSRGLS